MKEPNIELAKKRIWKRMESKLPERGTHVFAVSALRKAHEATSVDALKRVQSKEHLLDLLPENTPVFSFLPQKVWALGSLSLFLGALFVPLMEMTPSVSAASENLLDTVSGEVFVNGTLVSGLVTLQLGDRVETGEGAMAHIYLLDDSRVTLGPSTQVDLITSHVDPLNRAKSEVELRENKGRVWAQVLNLVSNESYFEISFPEGQVLVTQKASFDVQVSDEGTSVEVARNLVEVTVNSQDLTYEGVLGQGASLHVDDTVTTDLIAEDEENEVWWTFNTAFGKSYARTLDENYKKENIDRALILPGNPLYVLKTFRENLQVSLALSDGARQNLLVEQAQNRLSEAQTLLAQGKSTEAAHVLEVYQKTVEQVQDTDNAALLAQVDETQKQLLLSEDPDAATLVQDHLSNASALVASDPSEKTQAKMLTASQTLQQVPDLIDAGDLEQALQILADYQDTSLSTLADLDSIPMDQREAVVSRLLEQKMQDIQQLRVIASMPSLAGNVTADSDMMEQLSVMVLSLREKELGDLSSFFSAHDYDANAQQAMYDRLKEGADLTEEMTEQLDTVEEQIQDTSTTQVLIDVAPVTEESPEDPRFSVAHADEPKH